VQVNVAYRWFLGFSLTDEIPDASTISQNRRRRFVGPPIYQAIFDAIVEQPQSAGLVNGRVLYTDSTHLKASANKKTVNPAACRVFCACVPPPDEIATKSRRSADRNLENIAA
jgi:hypothetical protein